MSLTVCFSYIVVCVFVVVLSCLNECDCLV